MSSCKADVQSRHPDLVSPSETGLGCEDRRGPVLGAKGLCPQGHPWRQEKAGPGLGTGREQALVWGHTGGSVRMVSPPAHIRGADGLRLGVGPDPRVTDPTPAFLVLLAPHPGQASPLSCWRPASGLGPGAEPGAQAGARAGLRPTSCQAPKQCGEIDSHPLAGHMRACGTAPLCPVPRVSWPLVGGLGRSGAPALTPQSWGPPSLPLAVSLASPASSCTSVSLSSQ